MTSFKCDYCGRILRSDRGASFACTYCGHGKMKEMKSKATCAECGGVIYDNIEAGAEVVCGTCTAKKVARVEWLERQVGRRVKRERINNPIETKHKWEPKSYAFGTIRNKDDYELAQVFESERLRRGGVSGEALEKARKRRGISQKTLAVYLRVSPNNLCQQEKGHIPLTIKALDFIDDGFKWQNEEN